MKSEASPGWTNRGLLICDIGSTWTPVLYGRQFSMTPRGHLRYKGHRGIARCPPTMKGLPDSAFMPARE